MSKAGDMTTIGGVRYVAVASPPEDATCDGCDGDADIALCNLLPCCCGLARGEDDVVWQSVDFAAAPEAHP
jgi:hypothetical protein